MTTPDYDLVIYHGPCFDGFTAAWVARQHLPGAEFLQADYNSKDVPDVTGRRVLIVDFTYPRETLLKLHDQAEHLIVLDHHKTAAEDLQGLDFAEFDMDRSGAGMAWDHFNPGQPRPPLVAHVEDRDLWRFNLANTKSFHAALSLGGFDFDRWDFVHAVAQDKELYMDFLSRGDAVLQYIETLAEALADRCAPLEIPYGDDVMLQVYAVDCPVQLVSETGNTFVARDEHTEDVFLGFRWDAEEGHWVCSLRSGPAGPDVGRIAKYYGGGGHQHAAGFRLPMSPPEMARKAGVTW